MNKIKRREPEEWAQIETERDTLKAEVDQYKMQLSTALNECLDTVLRENSLVVALNKKDAENERLHALETERADFLERTIGMRSLEHFVVRWKELEAENERLRAALLAVMDGEK